MLTKELLKFTKRSGKVHPKYLNTSDMGILETAQKLDELYKSSLQSSMADLEERLNSLYDQPPAYFTGFCKLLTDRCKFQEDDNDCLEQRWRWFKLSRELRHDITASDVSRSDFEQQFALAAETSIDKVKQSLYADLPSYRKLVSYDTIAAKALVDRYNCAQIQGLLIHALSMKVVIGCGPTIEHKRALVQKLKFHRLLAEIDVDGDQFSLDISGPLSFNDARQNYGLRLANFFPYILLFKNWKLSAELRMGQQTLGLELDHKKVICSHYKGLTGYIPQEFQAFLSAFNARANTDNDWRAVQASDFIQLSGKSYCFPDIKIAKKGREMVFIEIFHRWHHSQLAERLEALALTSGKRVILAICKSLKLNEKSKEKLRDLERLGIRSFHFRDFPTPSAVLTQLSAYER